MCPQAALRLAVLLAVGLGLTGSLPAATWPSTVTGRDMSLTVLPTQGAAPAAGWPLVIYLQGLAAPRVGTEPDAPILRELQTAGYLVVALDYAGAPDARWPALNRELYALRKAVLQGKLLSGHRVDQRHVHLLPAGYRLRRDVVFARDGERLLAMDIAYPSKPRRPVGAVLEFSCDNVARMGNGSLTACSDTLLDAAATEGFIVAMADHPVPAPYQGLDPMPACAVRIKAAVRTLRAEVAGLGGNGRIVPVGFSRGSGMALLLVTTEGMTEFDAAPAHPDVSSAVQGAVILSGRFTYLDLLADDHMLPRYARTWGERETHLAVWRRHGALDYLEHPTVPLFLSINHTESADALHQMDVLRSRLAALGSGATFVEETEPRGHKVPLAAAVLEPMGAYLRARLDLPAAVGAGKGAGT
ncbi:hypothetical protein DB354_11480 [Opitutus sp. ER46]|nr:hypothetical protein DB354_11480 [Opitutus sp. ER46]